MSWQTLFGVAYAVVLLALFAYGANGYVLLWARRRYSPRQGPTPDRWPSVAVQIPIYNERDVVRRVIQAAGRLRYPGPLEIQVLDDSTDDTPVIVGAALRRLEAAGVAVSHVRRTDRSGFKAGALAAGLRHTQAELLLILDADFVPEPDLLERLVPLMADARTACVQSRWGHLNPECSPLTRAQALGIDVHFVVEQQARVGARWPVSFNGSGGLWRRAALEDAGGWSADTLTEDLDLSYRAWLRGWQIGYAGDVSCPAEIPETVRAFKAQQRRWAHGSTATARKLLADVWRSKTSLGTRIQATLHLTHYAVHPLLLLSALLAIPFGVATPSGSSLWAILPPLAMATGGPIALAMVAGRDAGVPWTRRLRDLGSLMLLGTGLAVSNSVAVVGALIGRRWAFARTPKGGQRSSYVTGADSLGLVEIACGLGCAAVAAWLAGRGIVTLVPFLLLYAAGLGRVGVATLLEGRSRGRHRPLPTPVRAEEA